MIVHYWKCDARVQLEYECFFVSQIIGLQEVYLHGHSCDFINFFNDSPPLTVLDSTRHPQEIRQVGYGDHQPPIVFGVVPVLSPPHFSVAKEIVNEIIDAVRQSAMAAGAFQPFIEFSWASEVVLVNLVKENFVALNFNDLQVIDGAENNAAHQLIGLSVWNIQISGRYFDQIRNSLHDVPAIVLIAPFVRNQHWLGGQGRQRLHRLEFAAWRELRGPAL